MKAMKKITVTFMALIMVVAMIGMFAVNVSAAKETVNSFTVQVIDLVAVDRDGVTTNYGTRESTFTKVNMTVVNSTTVKFTYNVWFAAASGMGDSQAMNQEVTVNDYSCTKDLDVSIDKSFSQGGDNWTYKMKITKSAGHLYDNACDTNCNICGQTRTVTHNYQNGTCTVDAVCTVCGDVKDAPGHNYVSGSCTECGEACSHTGTSSVVVDLQDGTHREQYNCCGKYVKTEPHKVTGNNGFCSVCGGYEPAVLNGDVYEISNAGQLYWFAQYVNKGNENVNGRLMADIVVNKNVLDANGDLNGAPESFRAWTPIGDDGDNDAQFEGSFYGDGHTVSGLYSVGYGTGFFGYTWSAKIYNLGVLDSYFYNDRGGYATGAIIGYVSGYADSRVENCFSNATIAGATYLAGGLFGTTNAYPQIINCYYFGKTVGAPFIKSGSFGNNSVNNFYVSTDTDNYSETTAISASALASGELAYLLNGSVGGGSAWGQVIGTDAYPLPIANDNNKVYYTTGCNGTLGYENYEKPVTHDASVTSPSRFNADGECLVCGTKAVAKVVTTDNVTNMYTDIYEAAAYATGNSDSVMTLLSDVELSGAGLFSGIDNKKSVTLDLNGKTLLKTNDLDNGIDAVICWDRFNYTSLEHTTLTINDSLGGGRVVTTQWHALYTTSSLVINGGTFEGYNKTDRLAFALTTNSISAQYGHTITINGGTFIASYGVSTDNFMTVTINGGTFQGLQYDFHNSKELYGENSPYGGVVINSASFPGGMKINSNYSDPIMKLLAKNSFVYKADGSLASLTDTIKKISGDTEVKIGADLSNATVVVNGEYAYIGKPITPVDVVVTIQGRVIAPEHYTLSYANNTDVGTATVTVTAKGSVYTGTADASFTIGKGSLELREVPKVTYEFGDTYVGKPITGGKVVVIGNDTMVIPGTWTWVEGTARATFTIDAQYADLFEEMNADVPVLKYVIASSPIITLSTPSPAIMPGMRIRMIVDVKNSFDESITELPTKFRVTYSVNGGSPTTVSGLEFTLPADVTLGDSVEVYVENLEEVGKYRVARSNTVKLAVGQVDYTGDIDGLRQELQDAVDALNDTLSGKANASDLESAIERLEDVIANLRVEAYNYAELGDRLLQQELLAEIEGAKLEAIDTAAQALADAKAELQAAIDANESDIEDKVARLDEAYKAADALINSEIVKLQAEDAAIKASIAKLEEKMDSVDKALDEAIKTVEKNLADAKAELQAAIDANEADIEDKVARLDEAYKAADALINSDIVKLQAEDTAIKESIVKLEEKMDSVDKALDEAIKTVEKNLADAKAELQEAIDANETDIEDKVARLDEAYKAADALINSEIAKLQAEDIVINQTIVDLEGKMSEADMILDRAISKLSGRLNDTKNALEKAIADLEAAMNKGDADLSAEIAAVNEALAKAVATLEAADSDNKAELTKAMNDAYASLDAAIKAVQKSLDNVKAELTAEFEAKIEAKTQSLETFIIVVCVIAGVSFVGSGAFIIWFLVDKKKRV